MSQKEADAALKCFKLANAFIQKFWVKWPIDERLWGIQLWDQDPDHDVVYFQKEKHRSNYSLKFSKQELLHHFSQKATKYIHPVTQDVYQRGSIAVKLGWHGRVKVFCADFDYDWQLKRMPRVLEVFKEHNIPYIYEYAGRNLDRAHLWFFCDTEKEILKAFVDKIMTEAGITPQIRRKEKFEFYGSHYDTRLIRLLGGHHIRSGCVNPIEWNGVKTTEPYEIMQAVIDCPPVPTQQMIDLIAEGSGGFSSDNLDPKGILRDDDYETSRTRKRKTEKVLYVPQNLKYEFRNGETLPYLHRIFSECRAVNRLLKKLDKGFLDDAGTDVHEAGVALSGVLETGYKLRENDENEADEYLHEASKFFDHYRIRDFSSHQWMRGTDFSVATWRCETFREYFDKCKGCPHAGRIENPHDLYTKMKPIKMEAVKDVEIDSCQNIAKKVWDVANKKIKHALDEDEPLTLFIKSPQQTFKTTNLCQTAARLSGEGNRILILVPTGQIAYEVFKRLRRMGQPPFVVMSHKNLFKYMRKLKKIDFDCPDAEEIQEKQSIGVSRAQIKKDHCRGCQFIEGCPFPNQYSDVADTDKNIIIAQHAHASTKQAMAKLMMRGYDIMFVDETFVNSMFSYAKVTNAEVEVLKKYKNFPWIKELLKWFDGDYFPGKILRPDVHQMQIVRRQINYHQLPYNIRCYIQGYNSGDEYVAKVGVLSFHPWPNIKRSVFTDATAPLQLSAKLLNIKEEDIQVVGSKYLVNHKLYNKNNQRIKVIDASNSVSSLADTRRVERLLRTIGIRAQGEWKNLSILVTAYGSSVEKYKEFFKEYYPQEAERIIVANMSVGTNEWKDVNVQVLMAGVHSNALDLKREAWKYKYGVNYWRESNGKDPIWNPYPFDVQKGDSISTVDRSVFVNMLRGNKAVKIEFPELIVSKPEDPWEEMVDWVALGKSQQADRIRTFNEDVKIVVDVSNRYRHGLLYDQVVWEDDWCSVVDTNGY